MLKNNFQRKEERKTHFSCAFVSLTKKLILEPLELQMQKIKGDFPLVAKFISCRVMTILIEKFCF